MKAGRIVGREIASMIISSLGTEISRVAGKAYQKGYHKALQTESKKREQRIKQNKHMRKYRQTPQFKKYMRDYMREYSKTPKYKKYIQNYMINKTK